MPEQRHHTAILALLAVVAAATVALFLNSDRGGEAAPFEPPAPVDAGPDEPGSQPEARAVEVDAPITPRVAGGDERRTEQLGTPPSDGVLDVRITPTARVAGKFGGGTLTVEEMLNPKAAELRPDRRPWLKHFPFKADPYESPHFVAIEGVPFSPYGYRVTATVEGFNGSSQVVRVAEDSWNPQVDLTVTPAAAFTLRVVDQELAPYVEEVVTLIPTGEPRGGRPILEATTDSFGTAFFEKVLAGDYSVKIGFDIRGSVTVVRPGFIRDDLDSGNQSELMKIPRGATVKIEVFDIISYALGNVRVRAIAIDTTENRRYEKETDVNGVCTFEHVVPGRYQIDVDGRGYQRTSRPLTIEAGKDPAPLQFRLPRLQ